VQASIGSGGRTAPASSRLADARVTEVLEAHLPGRASTSHSRDRYCFALTERRRGPRSVRIEMHPLVDRHGDAVARRAPRDRWSSSISQLGSGRATWPRSCQCRSRAAPQPTQRARRNACACERLLNATTQSAADRPLQKRSRKAPGLGPMPARCTDRTHRTPSRRRRRCSPTRLPRPRDGEARHLASLELRASSEAGPDSARSRWRRRP